MPIYDPNLTADKAAERLPTQDTAIASGANQGMGFDLKTTDYRRKSKRERVAPPELSMIADLKRQRVHIFNVGPWRYERCCGSIGTFIIPANLDSEGNWAKDGFVEMVTPLYAVMDELVIVSEREYKRLSDEGRQVANEILGLGRGNLKENSLVKVGCFTAKGDLPTEEELEEARAQLMVYCQDLVLQMRTLWDRDRKVSNDTYRANIHGMAARILGLDEEWMTARTPTAAEKVTTVKCRGCKTEVEADAPMCFKCGGIVNADKYIEYKAEQESILEATRPKQRPQRG